MTKIIRKQKTNGIAQNIAVQWKYKPQMQATHILLNFLVGTAKR